MPSRATDLTGTIAADLTADLALDLLAQAVAERGRNYRYSDAHPEPDYTDPDGTPACLVGRALHLYGVPAAALHTWDDAIPAVFGLTYPVAGHLTDLPELSGIEPSSIADPNYDGVPPATETAIRVLWAAQIVQDSPATWGEALDAARTLHAALTQQQTHDPTTHEEQR